MSLGYGLFCTTPVPHRTSRKKTPWTARSVCGSGVARVWYHINCYSMVQCRCGCIYITPAPHTHQKTTIPSPHPHHTCVAHVWRQCGGQKSIGQIGQKAQRDQVFVYSNYIQTNMYSNSVQNNNVSICLLQKTKQNRLKS